MISYDLTRVGIIKSVLINRWPQLGIRVFALSGFLIAILAGLFGTPVGNRNFSIVFVWILWWALVILVAVPLLGRGWCNVCPIPIPGEWLQNGAILGPQKSSKKFGLNRRWPKTFRNIWLQNIAFTLLALFSVVILTQPRATGLILLALLIVAMGTSLIYERRAFCRYLCPVGGFIGLYSQVAPVELRVRDTVVCTEHKIKTCYTGNDDGYGCPWNVFPGGLIKNTNCGTCMECLRTCPHDNIAVNIRAFGSDLVKTKGRKLDEAFKAFIMLGSAMAYSAILLGPWGFLKSAANSIGSLEWFGYVIGFLLVVFVLLPGLFLLSAKLSNVNSPNNWTTRQIFISYSYSLIPLGLAFWIAFSISFVFSNFSYVWPVISDPFGWGWDLIGTAATEWFPYFSQAVPFIQTLILIGGLIWAGNITKKIASEQILAKNVKKQATPIIMFCTLVTVGMIWLLVG